MNYPSAYPSTNPLPASLEQGRRWLSDQRLVAFIIVASVGYQLGLCLLNTTVMPVSRAIVGLAEAIILAACVPLLLRRLLPGVLILACLSAAMLCLLAIANEQVNVKAYRDIAIPLCYFWLGANVGRLDLADRALKMAICMVLAMGFYELLFLDAYTRWFDIFSYYVNIGSLNEQTDLVREDRLQANGMRPEGIGRTLLPGLLGPHRVSSVFLEPVSLGNFASLCAAWGLARSNWREGAFFVIAAVVMMVLCDSRFALMTVTGFVALRFLVKGSLLYLCIFTPVLAVVLLMVIGYYTPNVTGRIISDDLHGRLAYSGWSLLKFDIPKLFGVGHTKVYYDEGYAHALATFGLPMVLVFWCSFWFLSFNSVLGQRFRAMVSLYIALILCISGFSFFALKSAGLLWFLVGCSLQKPAPLPASAHPSGGTYAH